MSFTLEISSQVHVLIRVKPDIRVSQESIDSNHRAKARRTDMESGLLTEEESRVEFLRSQTPGTPEPFIYEGLGLTSGISSQDSGYAYTPPSMHEYFGGPDGGSPAHIHYPFPNLGYIVSPDDWDSTGPMSPASVSTMDSIDNAIIGFPSFQSEPLDPVQWH